MLRTFALAAALAAATPPGVALANLLANGDFDTDVAPWADPFPNPETIVSWSAIDAEGEPASGSLQVQTNLQSAASDGPASECIAAQPGPYTLSGLVFLASSAGSPAAAYLSVQFHDTPVCTGDPIALLEAFAIDFDIWTPVTAAGDAPLGTAAVRVRAMVGSTTDTVPDVARFDRLVLVPEPGAAPLAVAAGLTLAARARRRGAAR